MSGDGWQNIETTYGVNKTIMIHDYMPSNLKQSREGQGGRFAADKGSDHWHLVTELRNGHIPLQSQNLSILW